MINGLPTLDDIEFSGKSVLIRVDINSPIVNSTILDTSRFESHIATLKELEDSKLVILTHQSRPGKKDYTTLESHAEVLSNLLGKKITYIDEIFSSRVIKGIEKMERGDIILLNNVRLYAEEQLKRNPEEHSESLMVSRLKNKFDLYVNDAFSASHRANASLVGFTPVIPSVVGRLVEKEVNALSKALHSKGDKIFILGGAKISDSVKVMKNVLTRGIAKKVALSGVVAMYFLMLDGVDIGKNKKIVDENREDINDREMRKLWKEYKDNIILPVDFGIITGEKRSDVRVDSLKGRIMDIGIETISILSEEIPKHDIAVINGPSGVFEDERFALGTFETLKAVSNAPYSIVGGGHISSAARMIGIEKEMSHVSTGGGACIRFLSGEKLVALEVVKEYWKKKWGVKVNPA